MSAPLPQSHGAPSHRPSSAHAGLWFDKFCDQWSDNWRLDSPAKLKWIQTVTNTKIGDKDHLTEHVIRARALVKATGGQTCFFKTSGRFATGLGREHPIENGFAWHPILGTPYLPGSSVKGLVRNWAETWLKAESSAVAQIFGGNRSAHVGSVIFHDALPTKPIQLNADVMTPHYGPYYEGKRDNCGNLEAPADWHSPVPIPFLTVADSQPFLFLVSPRTTSQQNKADCQQVATWLTDALQELGAGAKTAVGYGRFVADFQAGQEANKAEEAARKEAQADRAKEAFAASLANLTALAQELRKAAREQNWENDPAAFKNPGVREGWMTRLEADPQPDAIDHFGKLIEKHDPDILANPERKQGKKNKPAYKDTSIAIAKRINKLTNP